MTTRRRIPTRFFQPRLVGIRVLDEASQQAAVRPCLVASTDKRSRWLPVEASDQLEGLYPPRGFVALPAHLARGNSSQLLNIVARQLPFTKDETGIVDRWEAQVVSPLNQLIDLLPHAENVDSRRTLMSTGGVGLDATPLSSVLLQVKENVFVGPFSLVAAEGRRGYYRVAESDLLKPIPVLKGDAYASSITFGEREIIVEGPDSKPSNSEYWDWSPDESFVREVTGKLTGTVTDGVLWEVERALGGGSKKALTQAQTNRLIDMIRQRRLSELQTRDILRQVQGSALGVELIGEVLHEDLERARKTMLSDLEAELSQTRHTLERELELQQELVVKAKQSRERVLLDLDVALDEQKSKVQSLERRAGALEEAFERATLNLVERVVAVTSKTDQREEMNSNLRRDLEDSILREIEGLITDAIRNDPRLIAASVSASSSGSCQGGCVEPPFAPSSQALLPIDSPTVLINAVAESLERAGFGKQLVEGALAAWSERLVPLVAGNRSLEFLEALADRISNGQLLVVHVHPTTTSINDLVGRVDERLGRFMPAPTRLAELLIHASDFLYPVIVVLEGINRVPIESSFLPLLESYAVPERRPIRLAALSSVHPDDPFASLAEFTWPPNLLLAATLVEGTSVFSIPKPWWTYGTLIDAERRLRSGLKRESELQGLELAGWDRVVDDLQQRRMKTIEDTLEAEAEEVGSLPVFVQSTTRRFGRALGSLFNEDPVTPAIAQVVLPALIQAGLLEFAEQINSIYFEDSDYLERLKVVLQS